MSGACSTYGEEERYTGFRWGKLEGKRPLGRHRRRCEKNIEMDFQEVGSGLWTGVTWLRTGTGSGHLYTW